MARTCSARLREARLLATCWQCHGTLTSCMPYTDLRPPSRPIRADELWFGCPLSIVVDRC
jgi:hypothetical protein